MALQRAAQRVSERFSETHSTTYAAEFTEMLTLADSTFKNTLEIIDQMERLMETFKGAVGLSRLENTGEAINKLAQRLPRSEPYSQTLLAGSESHQKIGHLSRKLQKDVRERVITPLRNWTTDEYAELRTEREKLERRRLEMDSATVAFQKKPTDEKKKERQRNAEKIHEIQYNKVVEMIRKLPDHWHHHDMCMRMYLQLQRDYHKGVAICIDDYLRKSSGALGGVTRSVMGRSE